MASRRFSILLLIYFLLFPSKTKNTRQQERVFFEYLILNKG